MPNLVLVIEDELPSSLGPPYLAGYQEIEPLIVFNTLNNPLCITIVTLTALQKPFNLHLNYFMQTSINNLILGVIVI